MQSHNLKASVVDALGHFNKEWKSVFKKRLITDKDGVKVFLINLALGILPTVVNPKLNVVEDPKLQECHDLTFRCYLEHLITHTPRDAIEILIKNIDNYLKKQKIDTQSPDAIELKNSVISLSIEIYKELYPLLHEFTQRLDRTNLQYRANRTE